MVSVDPSDKESSMGASLWQETGLVDVQVNTLAEVIEVF